MVLPSPLRKLRRLGQEGRQDADAGTLPVASSWAKTFVEERAGLIHPALNAIRTIGRHLRRVYADGGDK
jgi:hypothetical protein